MGSVNKVILVGNLGRDPEVRSTQNGGKIVNLNLATTESWKDKESGERTERTEWHRVVIFNERLGDVAERYLKKGSKVYLEGQLQTRKWTDKDNQERYTTEIVVGRFNGELVLIDKAESNGGDRGYQEPRRQPAPAQQQNTQRRANAWDTPLPDERQPAPAGGGWNNNDLDDDIPF